MSNAPSVVIDGIDDAAIAADIEQALRESFEELAWPGPWHVVVRPSLVSGRWDFSVRGLDVRHTLSIAAPAGLLPSLIPRRLIESLHRIVSTKVEAAARRPLALRRAV